MSRFRTVLSYLLPDWATGVAGPAFGSFLDRRRVPPFGLRAAGERARGLLPTALVLLLGEPDAGQVASVVQRLARLGVDAAGVRPVVVLDCGELQVARRSGVVVDHVVAEPDWRRRHPDVPYSTYLERRLAGLRADYATSHVVRVAPGGWDGLDDAAVVALLRPPAVGGVRRFVLAALGRIEGLLDRAA